MLINGVQKKNIELGENYKPANFETKAEVALGGTRLFLSYQELGNLCRFSGQSFPLNSGLVSGHTLKTS